MWRVQFQEIQSVGKLRWRRDPGIAGGPRGPWWRLPPRPSAIALPKGTGRSPRRVPDALAVGVAWTSRRLAPQMVSRIGDSEARNVALCSRPLEPARWKSGWQAIRLHRSEEHTS